MTQQTTTETGRTLGELAKDIVAAPETPPKPKVNNGELLKAHELQVLHVHPNPLARTRGMTVAFKRTTKNANVIEVATAIVHPRDTFTKKVGTQLAVEAFISGRTTFLPIRHNGRGDRVTGTLRYYFGD